MSLASDSSTGRRAALLGVTALLAAGSSAGPGGAAKLPSLQHGSTRSAFRSGVAKLPEGGLRPGVFLYAVPGIRDPNFSEAVVLLVQHGSQGAMGLIINRPTELGAEEALPGRALRSLRVYEGGPVQREAILALVRTKRPAPDAMRVLEDVFLSSRRKDLEAAARDGRASERVRIYSGYSGWAAGQLEQEIRLGGWIIGRGDVAAIFSSEPQKLWRKVFQLLGRREAKVSPLPVTDPTLAMPGSV